MSCPCANTPVNSPSVSSSCSGYISVSQPAIVSVPSSSVPVTGCCGSLVGECCETVPVFPCGVSQYSNEIDLRTYNY